MSRWRKAVVGGVVVVGLGVGAGVAVTQLGSSGSGLSVAIVKTVDADGDGSFGPAEVPPFAGAPVRFRAVVTNTDTVPVYITSLTDSSPPNATGAPICNEVGTILQPGQSVTCEFDLVGGAPPTGSADKVRVTVATGQTPGSGGGTGGAPCADPDPAVCRPPCFVGPSMVTTTTDPNCTGGGEDGEAEDFLTLEPPGPLMPGGFAIISVDKTNDADGDGTFHDLENAGAAGATVYFRVVVRNDGSVDVEITALTDESPPGSLAHAVCPQLIGTTLTPGEEATCVFVVTAYAPPSGETRLNVVNAAVSSSAGPAAAANDSSVHTLSSTAPTTTTTAAPGSTTTSTAVPGPTTTTTAVPGPTTTTPAAVTTTTPVTTTTTMTAGPAPTAGPPTTTMGLPRTGGSTTPATATAALALALGALLLVVGTRPLRRPLARRPEG